MTEDEKGRLENMPLRSIPPRDVFRYLAEKVKNFSFPSIHVSEEFDTPEQWITVNGFEGEKEFPIEETPIALSHYLKILREQGYRVPESPEGEDEDPGCCEVCGAPRELVRPGKSQPTCDCHLKCPRCGKIKEYFEGTHPEFPNVHAWLCPDCGLGEQQ